MSTKSRFMLVKYLLKSNGQWDEITYFKNTLRNSDLQTCKVIIDFKKKVCVVNSLNREATFDDMLDMYKRLLGDQLTPHLPKDHSSL